VVSKALRKKLLKFRRDRDWEQFHSPRTLAIAISVEAAELLEHFQWIPDSDVMKETTRSRAEIAHEIADLSILLTYMAHDLELDLDEVVRKKLSINERKYPIERARGSPQKYTRL
jgi:NTP pyrophosphatase (non-canonical NTP hydrolase)